MKYISTRNKENEIISSRAIVKGIAEDGGLFVPEGIPKIKDIEALLEMNYKELAHEIIGLFFTDLDKNKLKKSIDLAYDKKFDRNKIAPLIKVGELHFLELFHGPTFAFKDMALSILPYLLKQSIEKLDEKKKIVILTATSGDTGKAALENFANVEGINIIVFFPEKGVSKVQKRQMLTQKGGNTSVISINGDFDDAQSGVKDIMNDNSFIQSLDKNGLKLSSANSINIGRLVPQIVYYFHAYLELLRKKKIKDGGQINFVVPTGNFGNILSGFYAKKMGLPIKNLICASNENNILTDFINTGIYDKRRSLKLTSSPSMDILVSSNLERLLFHLSGGNDEKIKDWMESLNNKDIYSAKDIKLAGFKAYYASGEEVSSSIKEVFEDHNYLMDPHTAVAHSVYKKYQKDTGDKTKTVIVSTASPFKFADKVSTSIGIDINNKDDFSIIKELGEKSNLHVPKEILELQEKEILHKNNCDKKDMEKIVLELLKIGDSDD
ncbi:MAG: threonine synthase [Tissierella sp.]|uniref:threonine synthase n=1 Tax=Tissierella sp. TaxID=41274 RepID=UPI003F99EF8D